MSAVSYSHLLFEHLEEFMGTHKLIGNDNFSILFGRGVILGLEDVILVGVFLAESSFDGFLG